MGVLDLARLLVGVAILSFASWTDWRWRRAPNVLWWIVAAAGLTLLAAEAVLDLDAVRARWPYLVTIPVFAGLIYGFWYLGLIAGGADAKALMALALLLPFPVVLAEGVPPWASPLPGAFTTMGNALIAFLVVPLALLAWNLAHGDVRIPHALLGVRRRGADVRRGHAWPMETIGADGARRTRLFASRMSSSEADEQMARLQALGDARVWVTPKIPFMLPLLAGFVATFFLGDVLMTGLRAVLGR